MKVTDFTPSEVQALVRHAESAPLQNLAHAEAVSKLLRKFAEWYNVTQQTLDAKGFELHPVPLATDE